MNTQAIDRSVIRHARRRRLADVLVLIVAVYAFLSAFWSPLELMLRRR
jgi:hypothetical protein